MGSGGSKGHETYTTAPTAQPVAEEPTPVTADTDATAVLDGLGSLVEAVSQATTSSAQDQPEQESTPADEAADAEGGAFVVEPPLDVLTPIPDTPLKGAPTGTPVLVGGADLADSTATLMSYADPVGGAPREVLLATVDEQAEAKLMQALELEKLKPAQVEKEVQGRLPLDESKQLYELTAKAAKSVNHKLKAGNEVPDHTKAYVTTAQAAVQEVLDSPDSTADELEMAGYYKNWLTTVEETIDTAGAGDQPYAQVKIPMVHAHETTGTVVVTTMVPTDPDGHGLPAQTRTASRINATIDTATGTTSWNGARTNAPGTEHVVDLGEGWSAVYRSYGANDGKSAEFSLRGQLEIHAPQGAGNGAEMVKRLGDLHLVDRALTPKEGEWTYLMNNIRTQGLGSTPQVKKALDQASALEEMQVQELFHAQADKAVGLDEAGLARLAKSWQVEAAASCLPKKVALVREAAATAGGFDDGAALASSPGYDPVPRSSGGWLTWSRWDVGNKAADMATAWQGKSLSHSIGQGSIAKLLATGVLASTERRTVMGISGGVGMSEGADKKTGGANAVFTRVMKQATTGGEPQLVWDDPPRILNNASIYGYPSDHFGVVNPEHHHSMHSMTTDPLKMATFAGAATNEVMFRNGLDLLGAEAPSRIVCGSPAAKKEVLSLLEQRQITHLAGKPIDQVVQ